MSKGGGTVKQTSDPWKPAQPYVLDSLQGAQQAYNNPPQYYPGQGFVGPTAGQAQSWSDRLGYMDSVFGGQPTLQYGNAVGGVNSLLGGGGMGTLANQLGGQAGNQLGAWNQFGTADGLNATGAINSMLSGQPDYTGLQGAVDAANAPILRQLNQEIIPGLNTRATFLNNETGGVKALNKVLPDVLQRMDENAQGLYNQERLRALGSRDAAAGMVAQGGQQANQGNISLGNLFGNLAGGAAGATNQGLAQFGNIGQMGQMPGDLNAAFADWGAGFSNQALQDSMNRWNYNQTQPMDMASWYSQIVNGTAGLGGSQKVPSNSTSGTAAGALGGAAAGAGLASSLGMSTGWGAGLGALAGYF
jgi:hypothetical protein